MEMRTGGMALRFSQARACLTLGTILKIRTESLPKSSIRATEEVAVRVQDVNRH